MIHSFLQHGIVLLRVCLLVHVLELAKIAHTLASNDEFGLHLPYVLKGCYTVSVQREIPTSSKIHRQPRSEFELTCDSCSPAFSVLQYLGFPCVDKVPVQLGQQNCQLVNEVALPLAAPVLLCSTTSTLRCLPVLGHCTERCASITVEYWSALEAASLPPCVSAHGSKATFASLNSPVLNLPTCLFGRLQLSIRTVTLRRCIKDGLALDRSVSQGTFLLLPSTSLPSTNHDDSKHSLQH